MKTRILGGLMSWLAITFMLVVANANDHAAEPFAIQFGKMLVGTGVILVTLAAFFGGIYLLCRPTPEHDNG